MGHKETEFQNGSPVPACRGIVSKLQSFFSQIQLLVLVTAFSILVLLIGVSEIALAQQTSDDQELEEVLSGFDEEDSSMEEALSGFDDEDSGTNDEEILSGFDEEESTEASSETESTAEVESWSSLFGYTGMSLSYSYKRDPPEDKKPAGLERFDQNTSIFFFDMGRKTGQQLENQDISKSIL